MDIENNVDWYGFDKEKYTNATKIVDTKVGDIVILFDLSNYVLDGGLTFPCEAKVVNVYEFEIDVEVNGKTWEIYESQFGYEN